MERWNVETPILHHSITPLPVAGPIISVCLFQVQFLDPSVAIAHIVAFGLKLQAAGCGLIAIENLDFIAVLQINAAVPAGFHNQKLDVQPEITIRFLRHTARMLAPSRQAG